MSTLAVTSKTMGHNRYYNTDKTLNKGLNLHNAVLQANKAPVQNPNLIMNSAKCPHGFPGGACPICSGKMGGGGGGTTSTKKKQTGMSWNEAYALWSSIKRNERMAAQDIKAAETARVQDALLQKLDNTRLNNLISQLSAKTVALAARIQNTVAQLTSRITNMPAVKALNNAAHMLTHSVAKLIGVVDKLTAVVGERLKAAVETIKDNMNKILEKLLQSAAISQLITVFYREKEYLEDLLRRKIEEIKAKMRKLTAVIRSVSDELAEEYGDERHYSNNKNNKNAHGKDKLKGIGV